MTIAEAEKANGIKCGTFGASSFEQRQVATGDYKGTMNVWDVENLDKPIFSVDGHSSIINCIDAVGGLNVGYGAPEIATGSRDGSVKIWDTRQQEHVIALEPAADAKARDCWAVAFGNSYNADERCIVAGYDNGDIKMLDLRMQKMLWETNVSNGVVGIQFDRKDIEMNKMIVTTLESTFRVYDMRTQHEEDGFAYLTHKAHKSTVWCGKHLPQNRDIFMTTGGNGTLNLYKYKYPASRTEKDKDGKVHGVAGSVELLNSKKVADQPCVSFDWHPEKEGLCVMSCLDQTVKVGIVTKLNSL